MCNHLNLKILIHIFTIIYLIMIIIIMRGENFVAHRRAAEHRLRITDLNNGNTDSLLISNIALDCCVDSYY
jgi:hypothetical protein